MVEDKAKNGADGAARAGQVCGVCPVAALLGSGDLLRDKVTGLFPSEFVEHAVGARRELLLAVRSLVDHALTNQEAYLEGYRKGQSERASRKRGPQKVTVE